MVRRHLKNANGNKSNRSHDYQELVKKEVLKVSKDKDNKIIFEKEGLSIGEKNDDKLVVGFYAKAPETYKSSIILFSKGRKLIEKEITFSTNWERYYFVLSPNKKIEDIEVTIEPINELFLWVLNIVPLDLETMRGNLDDSGITLAVLKEILSNDALMPEIVYANHEKPIENNVVINNKNSLVLNFCPNEFLYLKYCSLCNRPLPAKDENDKRLYSS